MKSINFLSFILVLLLLVSCGVQRQIKRCANCYSLLNDNITVKDSISFSVDTVIEYVNVPADSSIQIIKIICDSLGNAHIKAKVTTQGTRSRLQTSLVNNEITVMASCLAFIDSIEVLNSTIYRLRSETNTVFVPKLFEKELSWWQRFKIRFGGWAFGFIALFLGYRILSFYAKSNNPLVWVSRLKR